MPFTESDDNQSSRKRSREAAHRLHDTVNHGAVQSIRTNEKHFTNPASIDFSHLISSLFCPKISANPIRLENVCSFIRETASMTANGIKFRSVDLDGRRQRMSTPHSRLDRMDLCAIQGRKSKEFLPVVGTKRGVYVKYLLSQMRLILTNKRRFFPFYSEPIGCCSLYFSVL